jgi:tetratricopeptide (TPR) repeat protein
VQRYRLLETTRAFMLEKLAASGNVNATRQRHACHVLHVLEKAMCELETTGDSVWLERDGPVLDDLRAALDWAMGEDSDDAVALAGASWPLWRELSLRTEGRQRLGAAAARLRPGTPLALEARLRHGLGDMRLNTAAMKAALEETERAVNLYRTLGDRRHLGSALTALGFSLFMLDRIEEAELAIREALNLLESSGWLRTLATVYYVKAHIETALGRFDAAHVAQEKATRLCEMAGADRTALVLSADLVQAALETGDVDGAISAGRNVTVQLRDTPHTEIRGFVLGVLAAALTARGNLNDALTAAREAAPLLRDEGTLFWLFDHLALRAGLAGHTKDAALIAGYSNAVHQKFGRPREPMGRRAIERMTLLLRDALPDEEIAQLGRLGAQLSEDQAMTIALGG